MPGAQLPNTGVILPALQGDSGIWGDELNTALTLLDLCDHTPGKGVKVPTAGLNINADLTFAGFSATNVKSTDFAAVTALSTGARRLFVSASDNELYWRSNAGTNVKLTNGATINMSLVGGIVGDYAAVGAEVAFDDANDRYTFKQQGSPKVWARMASGDVRLYETGTSETVYTALKCDPALVASYDIQLPLALPASTKLLQLSAAGLVTATGVLASNEDITFSGTGQIRHGSYSDAQTIRADVVTVGSASTGTDGGGSWSECILSVSAVAFCKLTARRTGDRVIAVLVNNATLTGSQNITYDVLKNQAGTLTTLLAAPVTSAASNPTLTLNSGGYQLSAGDALYLKITMGNATTASFYTAKTTFDHP